MGAIHRLLSLACSTMLTTTARVRARLTAAPSPLGARWLLPLLLAALGFMAEPPPAAADEIRLRQFTETDVQNGNGQVTFQNLATAAQTEGSYSMIFYGWGVGYTNDWRWWILQSHQFPTNQPAEPGSIAYDGLLFTNLQSYGWSGAGLALGTQMDAQRTVQQQFDTNLTIVTVTDTNVISNSTDLTYSYNDSPPWRGAAYFYTDSNAVPPRTYSMSRVSDVVLITSAGTNSALFKLTSGFGIDYYTNGTGNALVDLAGQYEFAGKDADTNGVVWKVLDDGTTNGVNVSIKTAYTNSITNFTFSPEATRVELTGIQWWNPTSSNWSSGALFVMSNSTVTFRITANVDDVAWPTNLPVWNCDGITQTGGATFTHTFTNVSASAETPLPVSATAGNTTNLNVVVYMVEARMTPEDTAPTRSGNEFGVCEILNLNVAVTPSDMAISEIPVLEWTATSNPSTNEYTITGGSAGAATLYGPLRTATVNITLTVNDYFAFKVWNTNASFIQPSDLLCVPVGANVWHSNLTASVGKQLYFYLLPMTVSWQEIQVREGVSISTFATGSQISRTNESHGQGQTWVNVADSDGVYGCKWIGGFDTCSAGPHTFGVQPPNTNIIGTFGYSIYVEYIRKGTSGPVVQPFTVPYWEAFDQTGKATIKKDSMQEVSKEWNDASTTY